MLFVFHPNVLKDSHLRFVGNELCVLGDRLRHAIVCIPTAVQGKIYEKHRPRRAT